MSESRHSRKCFECCGRGWVMLLNRYRNVLSAQRHPCGRCAGLGTDPMNPFDMLMFERQSRIEDYIARHERDAA